MPELPLTLLFPSSVNTYWRNTKKGTLVSVKEYVFRSNAIVAVYEQLKRRSKIIENDVFVSVKLYLPTKQTRDIDNFLKVPFDALTHAEVSGKDKQIKKMNVEWMGVIKDGKLEIILRQHSNDVMYDHN